MTLEAASLPRVKTPLVHRSYFPPHHRNETQNDNKTLAALVASKVAGFGNNPHPRPSAYPLALGERISADWAPVNLEQPDH